VTQTIKNHPNRGTEQTFTTSHKKRILQESNKKACMPEQQR